MLAAKTSGDGAGCPTLDKLAGQAVQPAWLDLRRRTGMTRSALPDPRRPARPWPPPAPHRRSSSRSRRTRPTGASTCSWTGSPSRATSGRAASRSRSSIRSARRRGTLVTRGFPLEPRAGRARRPPAPGRLLVQPRRRERRRLLEQLRGAHARGAREDGHDPPRAVVAAASGSPGRARHVPPTG